MSPQPRSPFHASVLAGLAPVVAPTAYDMLAARIIEASGFQAVFCSGYGQAASALGLPDDGSMTLDVLRARVRAMASSVRVPVLVDADTGFDDPAKTVSELAISGASAVMIEDQVPSKRCGHVTGKEVVSLEQMVERLRVANDARPEHLLLIARTDALEQLGLDQALNRGCEYVAAGADIVFVEAPESVEMLEAIPRELPCPAMVNIIPGGRTPELSVSELGQLGFRLVVFGLIDLMFATAALREGFAQLAASGSTSRVTTARTSFGDLNDLTGLTDAVRQRRPAN